MLIEFHFKNFKSFRDEATLSFVASSDTFLSDNLIHCPDNTINKVLSTTAIYGANASGKSTIFHAFSFAHSFVIRSPKNNPDAPIRVSPFAFTDSRSAPSDFEFTFLQNNIRYQYGFSVTSNTVEKEWLISYPKGRSRLLFDRNKQDYEFGSFLKGEKEKIKELTRSNALFLSVAATFNNTQLLEVYRWFVDRVEMVGSGEIPEPAVFDFVLEHPEVTDHLKNLIQFADLGIVDFSISKNEFEFSNLPDDMPENIKTAFVAFEKALKESEGGSLGVKPRSYELNIMHRSGDTTSSLPWDSESDGTRRLFGLSAPIFEALIKGKVIFVDEIDKSLHPLLTRKLIQLFQNPKTNPKMAQLVFNTHDTSLLSAGLLRRDQVWFLEKDQSGASHIYSLLEYSPRKDEALEKGYLQGRYGAIPFLGEFSFGE